jgi:uncharacterized membrane protein
MDKTRVVLFGSVVAAAMLFGGVLGATVLARGTVTPANAALTAATATPAFHSNENATHEAGESATQETAENNGTFHPGGGGPNGTSNETATHEAGEPAAQESAEKT